MTYRNFQQFYDGVNNQLNPDSGISGNFQYSRSTKKIRQQQLKQILDARDAIKAKFDNNEINETQACCELYAILTLYKHIAWHEKYDKESSAWGKKPPNFTDHIQKVMNNAPDCIKQNTELRDDAIIKALDNHLSQLLGSLQPANYATQLDNIDTHPEPLNRLVRHFGLLVLAAGQAKTPEQRLALYEEYTKVYLVISHISNIEKVPSLIARINGVSPLLQLGSQYYRLQQDLGLFSEKFPRIHELEKTYKDQINNFLTQHLTTLMDDWFLPPMAESLIGVISETELQLPPPPPESTINEINRQQEKQGAAPVDEDGAWSDEEEEAGPSTRINIVSMPELPDPATLVQVESGSSSRPPMRPVNPHAVTDARLLQLITQTNYLIQLRDYALEISTTDSASRLRKIFDDFAVQLKDKFIKSSNKKPIITRVLNDIIPIIELAKVLRYQIENNATLFEKLKSTPLTAKTHDLLTTLHAANTNLNERILSGKVFLIDNNGQLKVDVPSLTTIANYMAAMVQFFHAPHSKELLSDPALKELLTSLDANLNHIEKNLMKHWHRFTWSRQLLEILTLCQTKAKLSNILHSSKCPGDEYQIDKSFRESLKQTINDPVINTWSAFITKANEIRAAVNNQTTFIKEVDQCIGSYANKLAAPTASSRIPGTQFNTPVAIIPTNSSGQPLVIQRPSGPGGRPHQ
jgi:hypothetical protein